VKGDRESYKKNKVRNLYSSSNIIAKIKSRRVRWAGHVAHILETEEKILLGRFRD
jgi:hypothetical protein